MYTPTGDRNWVAVIRRVTDQMWWGKQSTAAIAPLALNNEYLTAMNAAGTATANLIKVNASNLPELATGTVLNSPTFIDANSVNRMVVGEKTLLDAGVSIFEVALPAGGMWGGFLLWTAVASDGTDHQSFAGITSIACVNKAGVYTKTITELAGIQAKAVSSGTITEAVTQVDGTNKVTYVFTPTGSLTETIYRLSFTLINNSRHVVTLL